MKKSALFVILALLAMACHNKPSIEKYQIKKADWLIGNWQNKTNGGTLSENWTKVNDSMFTATSLFIKDQDSIHHETIVLEQKAEKLTYTATIKGQNEDKPIRFELKTNTENELIFENLKNNYPQKISYKKMANNTIVTQISGMQNGKSSSEKYTLKK